MAGQFENELRRAVSTMRREAVVASDLAWQASAVDLLQAARQLMDGALQLKAAFGDSSTIEGQGRPAFQEAAGGVSRHATHMRDAAGALSDADSAMHDAEATLHAMGKEPRDPGSFQRNESRSDQQNLRDEAHHNRRVRDYDDTMAAREERSRAALEKLDARYAESAATMQAIHGEPDPPPAVRSGPDRRQQGSVSSAGSATPRADAPAAAASPGAALDARGAPVGDAPATSANPAVGAPAGAAPTGAAPTGATSSVPGGLAGSTAAGTGAASYGPGGSLGALAAGGLGAGLSGASGWTRGTTVMPPGAGSGTRPIGAGGRTATANGSVLGRRGSGAGGGAAGSGAGGRGGSRSAGAGAGRGRDRDRDRRRGSDRDRLDTEREWVDDEGTGPAVLG